MVEVDKAAVEELESPSTVERIRRAGVHWSVRIGIAAMVVFVVLIHFHLIHDEKNLLLGLSVLILLLSEQLHASTAQFEKVMDLLRARLAEQSTAVRELIEGANVKLLGLKECVFDLGNVLRSVRHDERVVLEHFSLDMTQAWLYFESLLQSHRNLNNVEYRLLILTDDLAKLGEVDDEVKSWARNVPWSLKRIERDVTAFFKHPDQRYRKVRFEVKKYASVPVIHGFRILEPDMRCYMAVCRWGGADHQKYEWGEPQYHRVNGNSSVPTEQDMLKIFDGYFQHFWTIGERAFLLEVPQETGGKQAGSEMPPPAAIAALGIDRDKKDE